MILALTGAGISVASGLPTYTDADRKMFETRNMQVIWDKVRGWGDAEPNPAHLALAVAGVRVVTQNIDGLHKKAGTRNLVELHGHLRTLICPKCGCAVAAKEHKLLPPCPACGEQVRPNVVLYGETVRDWGTVLNWLAEADHLLIIGTSLQVFPAAHLLELAERARITTTIINEHAEREVPRLLGVTV